MNWDNVISAINVAVAYFFLCTVLPAIFLHPLVRGKSIIYQFIFYNILSNLYIIMMVFILAYLNIFNRLLLILTIIVLPIILYSIVRRKFLLNICKYHAVKIHELFIGEYGIKLYIRTIFTKLMNYCRYVCRRFFGGKIVEWIIFLAVISFVVWFYGYYRFHYYQYGHTDEETHLYWIQSLVGGNIFPAGMYPHGLHNIVATISVLFNITTARATLEFSVTSTVMVMTMLYLFFRSLFKSRYAVLIGFTYFVIADIFNYYSYIRFQYFLPMEYGIVSLVAAIYFLYFYIKKKNRMDLFLFSASIAVTFAIHFYITMFAILICVIVGITFIIPIFKERLFFKLVIAGLIGIFISILPFVAGYCMGYGFERSIAWGVSMLSSNENKQTADDESATDSNTEKSGFKDGFVTAINKLYNARNSFYIMLVLEVVLLIYGLAGILFSKNKKQYLIYISLALIWIMTFVLYLCYWVGLPSIIETRRALIFLTLFSIPLFAIPFELFHNLLVEKADKRSINFVLIICLMIVAGSTKVKDYRCYWTTQTDEAMKLSLDLIEHYEDHTWTLVSSVNELSVMKNNGYHYESLDLAEELFDWDEDSSVIIPTKYVFFVIEKYPLKYFERNIDGKDKYKFLNQVSESYAVEDLPDVDAASKSKLYYTNRDTIMSRLFYWAKAYEKYYPNEMSVYYEDKMVVIYKLEQDPYALNNLVIDFGLNSDYAQK